MVQRSDNLPSLAHNGSFHRRSHAGYLEQERIDESEMVIQLTLPSLVDVIRHGYRPDIHPSAAR